MLTSGFAFKLYGACSERESIYIVTELMCHGTLLDFMTKGKGHHLLNENLIDAATQIASGMSYLEKEGCVHCDLMARNILVGENHVYKISGMRFVRMPQNDRYITKSKEDLRIKWTAPESVHNGCFTGKSDVWSFGILLTEVITKGKEPYPGMKDADVLAETEKGYRMECPTGCPRPLYEIMLKCWNQNPDYRPTFEFLQSFLEDYYVATEPSKGLSQRVTLEWFLNNCI